jgi:ribosomal protein S18 acetylase RimI-like enzyme
LNDSTHKLTDDPTGKLLDNPFWHALRTEHSKLAICSALACRYPADVVPFAGLGDGETSSVAELRELLAPGELIYVAIDELAGCPGIDLLGQLVTWQMVYVSSSALGGDFARGVIPMAEPHLTEQPGIEQIGIEQLGAADAPAMVALTDVAFPGYFRLRTYRMGFYYGIRVGGELVAMGGERLALPGVREVSAVCTHPEHTGRGYAGRIISRILANHAAAGLKTFLHVGVANLRAVELYERLGFVKRRNIVFWRIRRTAS